LKKISLFTRSLKLVWASAPGWASVNVIVSVFRSILPLALIILVKDLVDLVTPLAGKGEVTNYTPVIVMISAVVTVFFLDEISFEFSSFVRKKQSLRLESYMYGLLHEKAVRLDLINFENPSYFDILSRASREATWRPGNILNNLVSVFRGIVSLLLMAGVLFSLDWWLVLLLLAVNIPGIWLRLHFADLLYNFQRKQTPEARRSAYFNWILTGDRPARELRLFGLGNYFTSLFRESFTRQKEEELSILKKRTMIETVSSLFKASALFLVLYLVALRTISGSLTLGQMAMFILAFRQGMTYIRETFSSLASLYEDNLFIGDTFDFLNLKETMTAIEPEKEITGLSAAIEAKGISFTYPGNEKAAIDNVSFSVNKGEVVALVGSNGSGKSTLVRLLCRLYDPSSGSVEFDGSDIRRIDPVNYRKMFSVVFQDFMLYNLSAGENIRLGNIENKDNSEKIKSAARSTGIDSLIGNLPKGYDTLIGNLFDESRELSWGEWQKIALSRALFSDAPVLILDEPSSALDAATEYDIFSRFREIVKGRTAILISHRFTNVRLADRIIVLEKGRVAESGTHLELMSMNGLYTDMYNKQASRY
jgi:ATP-binding cassette, subfamily B, bacterial